MSGSALRRLSALIFPERCLFCGERIAAGELFCGDCRKYRPEKPFKRIYALPGFGADGLEIYAPMSYQDGFRETVHRYKFRGKRGLAAPLAALMASAVPKGSEFDVITWVPLTAEGKKKRGYDQSELLARELGKLLGLPAEPLLEKRRETKTQHELGRAKRLENVKNAYRAVSGIEGRRVLLIDDIVTTGATLTECARALCGAGAAKVTAICAADAQGNY